MVKRPATHTHTHDARAPHDNIGTLSHALHMRAHSHIMFLMKKKYSNTICSSKRDLNTRTKRIRLKFPPLMKMKLVAALQSLWVHLCGAYWWGGQREVPLMLKDHLEVAPKAFFLHMSPLSSTKNPFSPLELILAIFFSHFFFLQP